MAKLTLTDCKIEAIPGSTRPMIEFDSGEEAVQIKYMYDFIKKYEPVFKDMLDAYLALKISDKESL